MLFNFGKCKCLHTGQGNEDAQYTMGGTILNTTRLSADCVGASSVNIFKNEIDIYLRRAGYR